jgi:hypothetical protein
MAIADVKQRDANGRFVRIMIHALCRRQGPLSLRKVSSSALLRAESRHPAVGLARAFAATVLLNRRMSAVSPLYRFSAAQQMSGLADVRRPNPLLHNS